MVTKTNWLPHLIELRRRLLWAIGTVLCIFLTLLYFANDLYYWLSKPLLDHLPVGYHMIATSVASPFIAPLKLALLTSIVIAIPILLYHLWRFIAPGLYGKERKWLWPLLLLSTALFYAGMAFAYFAVMPLIFNFFIHAAPKHVAVMTDISAYLDFVTQILLAFGGAFEVPIAVVLMVASGVVTIRQLKSARPYIIVGAFVLGMLLTPPDVLSQILLALPVWALFELGLLLARLFYPIDKLSSQASDVH